MKNLFLLLPLAAAALAATQPARAALHSYYIGTDNLATFTTGTYSGLANPNFNRLTLLYQHANLTEPCPLELLRRPLHQQHRRLGSSLHPRFHDSWIKRRQ